MGIAKRQGILETATVVFGHRFRALVKHDGCGETTVSITVDKQKHGDEIVSLHGIKLLQDQKTAARFNYYQLDYYEESDGTFFLRKV